MSRARRKQFNPINVPLLARWIVITGFFSITGLIYVYQSIQLYDLGKQKTELEQRFEKLRAQNGVVSSSISNQTSYRALELRFKDRPMGLVKIRAQDIVLVGPSPERQKDDAIQPVVNQNIRR